MGSPNADVVRRYLEDANTGGDLALLDELVSPGYVGHFGWPPDRGALRELVAWQRRTAPDWRIEVLDVVADGDPVAVRAHASGTRSESSPGVAVEPYRLEDGRIAEAWPYLAPRA